MKINIPVSIVKELKLHFDSLEVITDKIIEIIRPEIENYVEDLSKKEVESDGCKGCDDPCGCRA